MLTAPQIVTKRTKSGIEVWISQTTLTRFCTSLSDGYLRRIRCGNKKGEVSAWKWMQSNGTYYYEYSSIPNKKPSMYASMLPTREELIELSNKSEITTSTSLEIDAKQHVSNSFTDYLPYYNSTCTPQQAINLSKACAFIDWMIKYIDEVSLDLREMELFKVSGEIISALDIKYLPVAHRNLKYKVLDILSGNASIVESVTLPRAGNDYAALHREDKAVLSWIYELRSSGKNYTNAFIIRKIQHECEKIGKPVPSDRWIGEVMEQHETKFLTASTRFGERGKYGNPYKTSIPTATALFAGDCWEMDATRVNILPHKGKNGKATYLNIVAVRDVHSGHVIGMSFDVSENRWSVLQALSNAVLNAGYLPYELRHDRFPGHNTEEAMRLFESLKFMGVKLTVAYKSTGKQRLERWFGSMQHLALQESPFYYGEGIMSNRLTAHRSMEYMASARKIAKENGWDFDQAINETSTRINTWLNTPYSQWSRKYKHIELSPVQLHEQSEKPNIYLVDDAKHAYLFGLQKTLQVRNNGQIHTTINNVDFIYQIEDFEVIKKYGNVLCCYDVEDLSKVHIYAPGKQAMKVYLGVAKEFIPPQLYGTNPEYGRLAKVRAMYSEIERLKVEELEAKKVANGANEFGEYSIVSPLTVSKSVAEIVETEVTNRHFGFDDGEDLNVDLTNQL